MGEMCVCVCVGGGGGGVGARWVVVAHDLHVSIRFPTLRNLLRSCSIV